ncbi:MAG: gliding motility protein GldN [Candidatus Azobacteroides sp.]|nr:gliding motility protein GldN [Candidatus Azobacteroides sp.]
MKSLHIIGLILAFLACSSASFSQNQDTPRRTPRQRASEKVPDNTPVLTERAKIKNEETSKAPAHVVWLREMYRYIDLEKDNNAALYYPVQPIGDRMNLFTTIFKLMADGKITAYNYLDGREVFTDDEKVNFEDILKKFQILYKTQGSGDNIRYIVDDADIPGSEVLQYQIKEGWYFDAATGTYKSQVIAICPLLVRTDYYIGDTTVNPLFWIPYETLRPYISRTMIMTSDYNNVMTYTIDDFFTKNMYKGDIVKTVNLKNQSLAQQVGNDPEKLKSAQDSIENQLKTFKDQLWVPKDTTQVVVNKSSKKETVKNGTVKNETAKKEKEEKPKAVKKEKSSSPASPTKSVRRTR